MHLDILKWKNKTKEAGFYAVPPLDGKPRWERGFSSAPVAALLRRRLSSPTSLKRLERYIRICKNERSQTHLNDLNELNSLIAEEEGKETFKYLHATRGYMVRPV